MSGTINSSANLTINSGATLTNLGTSTNSGLLAFQITGPESTQVGRVEQPRWQPISLIGGNAEFDLTGITAEMAGKEREVYLGDSSLWGISDPNITVTGLPTGLTWEIDLCRRGHWRSI